MGLGCSTLNVCNEKIKNSKINCSCKSSCMEGDDEIKDIKKFRKSLSLDELKKIKNLVEKENVWDIINNLNYKIEIETEI